jgi:hypothetical protein
MTNADDKIGKTFRHGMKDYLRYSNKMGREQSMRTQDNKGEFLPCPTPQIIMPILS